MKSIILLVAVIFLVNIVFFIHGTFFKSEVTITVSEKERVTQGSGNEVNSKYLVFTKEGEVFENTDNIFLLKFNSSDLQGKLRIDSTYVVEVNGYRIPFLSKYRNIIKIKN